VFFYFYSASSVSIDPSRMSSSLLFTTRIARAAGNSLIRQNAALPSSCAPSRFIATATLPRSSPLDQFRDPVDRQTRGSEPVGRHWSVDELRRKSYEDLHKLWYILYKERNMLLTEQQLSRRRQIIYPQPDRMKKVQKSMGAIKQVLGERKRRKISEHQSKLEQELLASVEEEN
jgi:large subunit ribosomal protein L47